MAFKMRLSPRNLRFRARNIKSKDSSSMSLELWPEAKPHPVIALLRRTFHKLKRPLLVLFVLQSLLVHWRYFFGVSESFEAVSEAKGPIYALHPHEENIQAAMRQQSRLALTQRIPHEPTPCEKLDDSAEFLPDLVFIPFEEATANDVLEGWEDEWISGGQFNAAKWGALEEPKIDFVYSWVNGSETAFQDTMRPYELASTLNDPEGVWLSRHGTNRYRDWDELRYSLRSISQFAGTFVNKIQILVNSVGQSGRQRPHWLRKDAVTEANVEVLTQEEFFEDDKQACLPTFNSLTIENQIFNTQSDVDKIFAMSDDMLLTSNHSASDIYSPLYGPTLGFKDNAYSSMNAPIAEDSTRFGEKPYLIYTSWLLNRRFGQRRRKGQVHFGHSISRSIARETIKSFPRPGIKSAVRRFRGEWGPQGEPGLQLYSWYSTFHYTIERHREALLWSYIVHRSDTNSDGSLSWDERKTVLAELEEGIGFEADPTRRIPNYEDIEEIHASAKLSPPQALSGYTIWTSLDGPITIQERDCPEFNVDECLAPGFSVPSSASPNPFFATANIFDRVARQRPECGDCLLKLLLNRSKRGLGPLLPHADTHSSARETVIKALMRYKYSIVDPNAWFVMVTDSVQIHQTLIQPLIEARKDERQVVSQLCLNDDVLSSDPNVLDQLRMTLTSFFQALYPVKGPYEI